MLLGLAAVVLLTTSAWAKPSRKSTDTFPAGGKRIRVEKFEPQAKGRYPAIILLHASYGLKDWGLVYRLAAEKLAARGYVVFVLHYFDRTGTVQITPKQIKDEQFLLWLDTVREAVAYTAKQDNVDAKRIGLLGFSLGAYLALAAAAPGDLPIAAVVELFGDLPAPLRKHLRRPPPILMVYGCLDRTVPREAVSSLQQLFRANNLKYEIKIYKHQDHLFMTDLFGSDVKDAQRLTLAFFEKHLKSGRTLAKAAK
jgi:carboxymethylenebutenolidase